MSGTLDTTAYVGSGANNSGSDSSTMVLAGGDEYLGYDYGTGTAANTTISGGSQYVGDDYGTGTATSTILNGGGPIWSWGSQIVGDDYGTGTAISTTISFGVQYVGINNGTGAATSTTISDGFQYVGDNYGNGTATSTTIDDEGEQYVGYNNGIGVATNTMIDDQGVQDVGGYYGTGTATSTTISGGGAQYVGGEYGTGAATSTTIFSGGFQDVGEGNGGGVTRTTMTATATSTIIEGGGTQTVGDDYGTGTATTTTIAGGGTQYVGYDGGTGAAINTTIDRGGIQYVGYDGGSGTATNTTVIGGAQYVGYDVGTGTATNTTVIGGAQYVGYDVGTGTATNTTISGGIQYVGYNAGTGTAIGTTIFSGGYQYVGDGYKATGTAINTSVSGGEQIVSSGGIATDTNIYSGGLADILSGGIVNSAIIDGGTLELAAGASFGTGGIDFVAASGAQRGTLDLTGEGSGLTFNPVISGFTGTGPTTALSDIIDVKGSGETGDNVVWTQDGGSGTLEVETSGGGLLERLTLAGSYIQNDFILTHLAGIDQITYDDVPCFVRGTHILTERGKIAVEALRVGDVAVTASGGRRPIVWIGHRRLDLAHHPRPDDVRPVRVSAGAFGECLPQHDLWLSPGHNVAVDGVLMPISSLINAASVAQIEQTRVEYWHVELDAHDILFSEGLPAESYLDTGNRTAFANGGAFIEAHPDFQPKHWAQTCLPIYKEGPDVVAARAQLRTRLEHAGYVVTPEADPHILADGVRIEPVRLSPTRLAFALPPGRVSIFLRSRAFIPASTMPASEDLRALGLSVARLRVDGDEIGLDREDAMGAGWHAPEREGAIFARRWTNGAAALPPGARFVMVDLAGDGLYWRKPDEVRTSRNEAA